MDNDAVCTLPSGTIIEINGYPCRLVDDTKVVNKTITVMGLERFLKETTPPSFSGGITYYGPKEAMAEK